VAVLISITVAAAMLVQDWRHLHLRSAIWLILFTIIGTPLGLLLLTRVPTNIVKAFLGLVIAAFSMYGLLRRQVLPARMTGWSGHLDSARRCWEALTA
jgi:hypothetical protein